MVSGLVFGPAFGLVAQAFGLTFTVPTAVMVGLVAGLIFGLIGGLVFGLAGRLTTSFEQSYPLRGFWSALRARLGRPLTQGRHKQQTGLNGAMQEPPYIAPVATVFGLVGGLAAGLSSGLFFGLTLGLLAALAAGLGCGLTVALVLGLSGELLFEHPNSCAGHGRTFAPVCPAHCSAGWPVGWSSGSSLRWSSGHLPD